MPSSNALRAAVASALLASGLGACAVIPATPPAQTLNAPSAYASATLLAAPSADWPGDQWWTAYDDRQLNGLMDEALTGSPDLAAAKARLAKAQAATAQARAATLPNVTANGSYASVKQSYNNGIPARLRAARATTTAAALARWTSAWELDFWGKNRAAARRRDLGRRRPPRPTPPRRASTLSTNDCRRPMPSWRSLFADRDVAEPGRRAHARAVLEPHHRSASPTAWRTRARPNRPGRAWPRPAPTWPRWTSRSA
jgi:hypothetical protein